MNTKSEYRNKGWYTYSMSKSFKIAICFVLGVQGWTGWSVAYACQISGDASPTCCCKGESEDSCPAISSVCRCCDVTVTEAESSDSTSYMPSVGPDCRVVSCVAATGLATVLLPEMAKGSWITVNGRANGPPVHLFVLNQSFRC